MTTLVCADLELQGLWQREERCGCAAGPPEFPRSPPAGGPVGHPGLDGGLPVTVEEREKMMKTLSSMIEATQSLAGALAADYGDGPRASALTSLRLDVREAHSRFLEAMAHELRGRLGL